MYVVHVLHKVLGRTTNDVLDTRDKIITCNSSQFNFSYYLKIGTRGTAYYLYTITYIH